VPDYLGLFFYQLRRYFMSIRSASAVWEGTLKEGQGQMRLGSGAFEGNYSFVSRFEEGEGTNPEELIGAALAGCFSMALSAELTRSGFPPKRISTKASIHFERVDGKATITRIDLNTEAEVPQIDEQTFSEKAAGAKADCPVSRALAVKEINLVAQLI
jgi:lipoyl-dependent peroxiredoxin